MTVEGDMSDMSKRSHTITGGGDKSCQRSLTNRDIALIPKSFRRATTLLTTIHLSDCVL